MSKWESAALVIVIVGITLGGFAVLTGADKVDPDASSEVQKLAPPITRKNLSK